MKYREILIERLKSLPYFKKKAIYQLSRQYALKNTTVDTYISRSLARRDIIQLGKGLYTTADFYKKNVGDISYIFYLANVIRMPSYVSSWAALQYYDLVTESIHGITSVTEKVTRNYTTKAGNFTYHSIKNELFSGFSLVKGTSTPENHRAAGKFDFFIASPAKALFDLLYFKTHQFRGMKFNDILCIIEELRIDMDDMDKKERSTFNAMIKKHLSYD